MANLNGVGIDPNVKENEGSFTVIPEGQYKMVMVSDELKPSSTGGKLLEQTWQIIDGPHTGHLLKDRLNIVNASETAQNIGQGTLKRQCSLMNIPFPPADTSKMYGIPVVGHVTQEAFKSKTTGNELLSNKITKYDPVSALAAGASAQAAPSTPKTGGKW